MLPHKPHKEKSKTQLNKEFQANKKAHKLAEKQRILDATLQAEQSQRTANLIEQGILPPSASNNFPIPTQAPSSPSKSKKARTTKPRKKRPSKPPATACSASIDTPRRSHKSKGVRPRLKDRKLLEPGQLPLPLDYYPDSLSPRSDGVTYNPPHSLTHYKHPPLPFSSSNKYESWNWIPEFPGQQMLIDFDFPDDHGTLYKIKILFEPWYDPRNKLRIVARGGWEDSSRPILVLSKHNRFIPAPPRLRNKIIQRLRNGLGHLSLSDIRVFRYQAIHLLSGRTASLVGLHCHHSHFNPLAQNYNDGAATFDELTTPCTREEHSKLSLDLGDSNFYTYLDFGDNSINNVVFSDSFAFGAIPATLDNKELQPFELALFDLAQKLIPDYLLYRQKYESIFDDDSEIIPDLV